MDVVWTGVFAGVVGSGIAMVLTRRSWTWIAAGAGYILGGIGLLVYLLITLTGTYEPPFEGTAVDVAVWSAAVGFLVLCLTAALTLIAIGRIGRRRFLVVFTAATLAVTTYHFWTSNWAARFGGVPSRCSDAGHLTTRAKVQRIPPGVLCPDEGREIFVAADGISWLALAGWWVFLGFAASFPLMGVGWLVRRPIAPVPPRAQA
jgi:hypothetical protein